MQEEASERRQVGTRETERSPRQGITDEASIHPLDGVETACLELAQDKPSGSPPTGQTASGVEVT